MPGLIADLIQVDAIRRIQEIYPFLTLHREDQVSLKRREQLEDEARNREIWEAVNKDLKK